MRDQPAILLIENAGLFVSGTIQEAGHFGLLLARTLRAMLAAHPGESIILFLQRVINVRSRREINRFDVS